MRGVAWRRLAPLALAAAGLGLAGCASPSASTAQPSATVGNSLTSPPAQAGVPADTAPDNPLGLDQAGLTKWFGTPSLIRRDEPAEVWQYRSKSCVLELYLYPVDDHMAVTHAEARGPGAGGSALKPCLSALSEARRKATQS